MAPRVLVTGASGFIGLHITGELLSRGYRVIGTVRTHKEGEQMLKDFAQEFPSAPGGQLLYVVIPDISAIGSFDNVFQLNSDVSYAIHTACPTPPVGEGSLEETMLCPAVEGTLNLLRAIKRYANDSVKNVVYTSSLSACWNLDKVEDKSFIIDELSWNNYKWEDINDDNRYLAYSVAKKKAEKAAWKFWEDEKPLFKLTAVVSPFVFGPQRFDWKAKKEVLSGSAEIVSNLLSSASTLQDLQETPISLAVDVRDLAVYHILPLTNSALEQKRLLPIAGKFSGQRILNVINENFPELNGKVLLGKPNDVLQIEGLKAPEYNNKKTLALIEHEFMSVDRSIADTVIQILRVNTTK
ncbi:BA75_00008T0 [Komagataella pastoris]|uniref:BA75_00008T0 n=1 Tax=Komagataella pastoris TaxID=4922 RepID=A0A1B2J897_PICPA|nr:BA75_00008T0 [Komagataella pastoris]